MTTKTQSNTPEAPPFWDKETVITVAITAVAMGLYACPILYWVITTI